MDEVFGCYDYDRTNTLTKAEVTDLILGIIGGKECKKKDPIKNSTVDSSNLIQDGDLQTFEGWFGNRTFSLNLLYRSSENDCNAAAWRTAVNGKNDTLTIAKSSNGKILGGYLNAVAYQSGWDATNTNYAIYDPSAFIFSLTADLILTIKNP